MSTRLERLATKVVLEDSEGRRIAFRVDASGDICIYDQDQPLTMSRWRFCGPGGDGAYALEVKKALREFIGIAATEINRGKARGTVDRNEAL